MKKFSEFGVKPPEKGFTGDSITMNKILNRVIVIEAFKFEDSKFNQGKRLTLQLKLGDRNHILWTSSQVLMEMIKKVPTESFPFETTIIEEDERFMFT
jgi:hypothetical protein